MLKLTAVFKPGDKAWCVAGGPPEQLTVGRVQVTVTDSPGLNDGRTIPGSDIQSDNYKPQQGYSEQYMMVETGIGSGNVYTLGEHVFTTERDARRRYDELMAERIDHA